MGRLSLVPLAAGALDANETHWATIQRSGDIREHWRTQPLGRHPRVREKSLGCAGVLRDLSQPKLVGDDARVGVEVVVPHPSGDEVNAFQVDERKPGGPGDELAVDPRPAGCGRPRIRWQERLRAVVLGGDASVTEPAVVECPAAGEPRGEVAVWGVTQSDLGHLNVVEELGMAVGVSKGNQSNARAIPEAP